MYDTCRTLLPFTHFQKRLFFPVYRIFKIFRCAGTSYPFLKSRTICRLDKASPLVGAKKRSTKEAKNSGLVHTFVTEMLMNVPPKAYSDQTSDVMKLRY